jgi:hypothetical protein
MALHDYQDGEHEAPAPRSAIRRFDVFAEYTRQERLDKGYSENKAWRGEAP